MGLPTVAVWHPSTEWPSANDPAISAWLRLFGARSARWFAGGIICLVGATVLLLGGDFVTVAAVLGLLGLMSIYFGARSYQRLGRRLPAIRRLLSTTPARRVRAGIVAQGKSDMVLSVDGGHLHVTNASWGIRQVVARLGEVYVVSPDADGNAVVLVEALPIPLAARVVTNPGFGEPEPVVRSTMVAAQDPLAMWLAKRNFRMTWASLGVLAALASADVFDVLRLVGSVTVGLIGAASTLAVLLVAGLFRRGYQHKLAQLLRGGDWQMYPVQVLSWAGGQRVVGNLRLALLLPDGTQLPVSVRFALAELVANVSASGVLWVAGAPRAGGVAAVGLPGYPVLAAARFVDRQR